VPLHINTHALHGSHPLTVFFNGSNPRRVIVTLDTRVHVKRLSSFASIRFHGGNVQLLLCCLECTIHGSYDDDVGELTM